MSEKYLEELSSGHSFTYKEINYVLSMDHKSNGHRMCVSLDDGGCRWLGGDCIVKPVQLFIMDNDNNFVAIKETKKNDMDQNSNFS